MVRKSLVVIAIAGDLVARVCALALAGTAIGQFAPELNEDAPRYMHWIFDTMAQADSLLELLLPTALGSLTVIFAIAAAITLAAFSSVSGSAGKAFRLVGASVMKAAALGAAGGATILLVAWIYSNGWNGWFGILAVIIGLILFVIMSSIIESVEEALFEEK